MYLFEVVYVCNCMCYVQCVELKLCFGGIAFLEKLTIIIIKNIIINDQLSIHLLYSPFTFTHRHAPSALRQIPFQPQNGGRGGSIGRVLATRSNGFHDQRFKSRPEHKTNL